ncbi:MAG: CopG family transcriptional regulator [Armatimonadota bacterium]|nr:MAG: CopG family transcriptional regulator [Armatimonadota bacterium]
MPDSEQVTLKIPRTLYERLKDVIADTGFRSVTEFAVYVLRDLASTHAAAAGPADQPRQPVDHPLTAEEIEAIRQRLRSLGYL